MPEHVSERSIPLAKSAADNACMLHASGGPTEQTTPMSISTAERSAASVRSENAYRAWRSEDRPSSQARLRIAEQLDSFCFEERLSAQVLGDRTGVSRDIAQGWRKGEKAFPVSALLLMPRRLAEAFWFRVWRLLHRDTADVGGLVLVQHGSSLLSNITSRVSRGTDKP